MLYSEIIAVCSEIHTKHINTLCGQNVEFVIVKPGGTYSNHWALKPNKQAYYGKCLHHQRETAAPTWALSTYVSVRMRGVLNRSKDRCTGLRAAW
jgi:hypothetical protein